MHKSSTSDSCIRSSFSAMACLAFKCTRRARPPEIPCSFMNLLRTAKAMAFLLEMIERRVMLEVILDTNHEAMRKPSKRDPMAKHRSKEVLGCKSTVPAKFVSDQCSAKMYCSKCWFSAMPRTETQLPSPARPNPNQMDAMACATPTMAPILLIMLKSSATLSDRAFSAATATIFWKRSNLTSRSILSKPMSWEALPAPSKITSIQSAVTMSVSGRNHVMA
mmetsp:Transcript_21384/g.58427  ORF Transcript_21384/g.58427 Transcript_21384/m.58427 type:complete len:221 (-) Transcript_21384:1138-1800(-)